MKCDLSADVTAVTSESRIHRNGFHDRSLDYIGRAQSWPRPYSAPNRTLHNLENGVRINYDVEGRYTKQAHLKGHRRHGHLSIN